MHKDASRHNDDDSDCDSDVAVEANKDQDIGRLQLRRKHEPCIGALEVVRAETGPEHFVSYICILYIVYWNMLTFDCMAYSERTHAHIILWLASMHIERDTRTPQTERYAKRT